MQSRVYAHKKLAAGLPHTVGISSITGVVEGLDGDPALQVFEMAGHRI